MQLDFYFDFLSPYSYFAWPKMKDLINSSQHHVNIYPVILGKLLNHWGQKGPAEIAPKRLFLFKDCLRYAKKNNISFTVPKTHPFNPLYALRLAVKGNAGQQQLEVIDCLWKAGWQQRIDMAEPLELVDALKKSGLPGEDLLERSFSKEIKQELKDNVSKALEIGIFGVPSFVVNQEVFWGNQSWEDVVDVLNQKDTLDKKLLWELYQSTPKAASQKI